MARNGSGTMSLTTTFVAETDARAEDVNVVLEDIADEITNSLALDGQSSMTGVLRIVDGSAAAPGIVFASDTDTGIYRIGSNSFGFAVNGSIVATVNSSGITLASGKALSAPGGVTSNGSAVALQSVKVTAGTGLSGGGDISADRTISLANTAVTAGSYTRATITVDAQGRLTAAANGASELPSHTSNAGRVLTSDGSSASWSGDSSVRARAAVTNGTSSTCTVGAGAVNIASVTQVGGVYTVTFTTALASANYQVVATKTQSGSNPDTIVDSVSKSTVSFTVTFVRAGTGGGQAVASFDFVVYGGF